MPRVLACIAILLASGCSSRDRGPEVDGVGRATAGPEVAAREPDAGPIALVPGDLVLGPAPAGPPPAVAGGTLGVTNDGHFAVAADPDRDVIWIVDVSDAEEPRARAPSARAARGRCTRARARFGGVGA